MGVSVLLALSVIDSFREEREKTFLFPLRQLREEVITVYVTLGELLTLIGILIDTVALCVTVFALITRSNKKK